MHVSYNNRPLFLTFTLLTLIWSFKNSVGIAPVMLFPYVAMLFPKRLTKNNKFQCLVMLHMFNNKKKLFMVRKTKKSFDRKNMKLVL